MPPSKILLLLFDLPVVEIPGAVVVSNASLEVPKMKREKSNELFLLSEEKVLRHLHMEQESQSTCNVLMHLLMSVHALVAETQKLSLSNPLDRNELNIFP